MKNKKITIENKNDKNDIFLIVVSSVAFCFFVVGFFYYTFIPYRQMVAWRKSIDAMVNKKDDTLFPSDPFIYKKYNNSVEGAIKIATFSKIFNQYVAGTRSGWTPLYDIAFNNEKDWIDRNPYRYDNLLSVAKGYEYKANLTGDKTYYEKANDYYQKALTLFPERQDLLYSYSQHLSNTGRKDEAVKMLEQMLSENPRIPANEYYLGVVLAANDKKDYDKAMDHLESSFDKGKNTGDAIILKAIYEHFFVHYYQNKDVKRFRVAVRRLIWVDHSQADVYRKISDYVDTYKQIPLLNIYN